MASESPLETLAAFTDHVIDIMKYALEDSYSEIPASPVARSVVDDDVPDLIDESGNVYDGQRRGSGELIVTGGVGVEGCSGRIGCARSICSPKEPLIVDDIQSVSTSAPPQLVVEGSMTVKGEVIFSQRNAELTQVQDTVDAMMNKLNELGTVLDHVEQMAVSDTRMNGLAEGISSACNAFASTFQTTEPPSTIPDLELGIQRVEDILHIVKDEVCTAQSQMDGLEYLLDKNMAEITDNLVSCETELSNQMTDIYRKLSSSEKEIRADVSELNNAVLDKLSYTLRELEDTIEFRASDLHSDAGSKHLEDVLDGIASVIKEDISVHCGDIHSDIDIVHRRLENDLRKVPDSVRDLLREDITNLKVAVQTCVNGLRQESKLDRSEREVLAKSVTEFREKLEYYSKGMDSLYENVNLFHEEFIDSSKIVEKLKLDMCSLTMDVRAIRDSLSSSKSDTKSEKLSNTVDELCASVNHFHCVVGRTFEAHGDILSELTEKVDDLTTYCEGRFEPQEDLLLELQKKVDSQQQQIAELTSMVRILLERVPEPQRKPNERDWQAL